MRPLYPHTVATSLLFVLTGAPLGCSSGGGSAPESAEQTPVLITQPDRRPVPIFLPDLGGSDAFEPTTPGGDEVTVEPAADAGGAPLAPSVDPALGTTARPGFDSLGDALLGDVPQTATVDGLSVLPRLQNRFRNNEDFDLWGCNPVERGIDLIVYSYIGSFGVLTQPDPETGSSEAAQADTYAVTETAPGVLLLDFLGLGRSEELRQFRFADSGDRYDAFSSSWGPIACARISAPF